jgi:uncharacterized membrane protein YhaH (DUF805 family)
MRVPELFDFRGQTGRSTFGVTLILGALVLHNIYRIAAALVTPHRRPGFGYLFPMSLFYGPRSVSVEEQRLLWIMVALAIPFLWVAVCVTVKRLRDLGLAWSYAVLLFIPAVNVLFFVLLCVVPGLDKQQEAAKKGQSFLLAILPASKWGSAVVGAFAGTAVGILLSWFSVVLLGGYGSVLVLALPFFMGFISAWLYGYHEPRSSGECYAVAMAGVFLTGAIIVGIAFEGIICVGMAAPLAIPLALLGARLGYEGLQTRHLRIQPKTLCGLFLVIPLLMGAEFRKPAPVPTHTVHGSVEIAAPPNAVWQRVVAFPRIQERPQWIFRLGMAYPLEVRTRGTGLSADRECVFSTGISREPILAWEESRHFAFRVSEEPPLRQEWSPYGQIHVRHLEDHDFRPGRVDFYLTKLPGGRTQLDCWSTYENRMWPGEYWRLWTDEVVRQIQLRVFRHITKLAEADTQLSAGNQ